MTQASRTWFVNKSSKIQARRTGHFLIADFASTAHMIQGQTLPAVFTDAQGMGEDCGSEERSSRARQISAYISFSWVRTLETI